MQKEKACRIRRLEADATSWFAFLESLIDHFAYMPFIAQTIQTETDPNVVQLTKQKYVRRYYDNDPDFRKRVHSTPTPAETPGETPIKQESKLDFDESNSPKPPQRNYAPPPKAPPLCTPHPIRHY